jgi:hypothetical protein
MAGNTPLATHSAAKALAMVGGVLFFTVLSRRRGAAAAWGHLVFNDYFRLVTAFLTLESAHLAR